MQSSLHGIVDAYQNPIPICNNYYYFRGSRSTRRTNRGATQDRRRSVGGRGVAHDQKEKLNFAFQRMEEERGHQENVNLPDPLETSGAKPSWLKLVLSLFKYD